MSIILEIGDSFVQNTFDDFPDPEPADPLAKKQRQKPVRKPPSERNTPVIKKRKMTRTETAEALLDLSNISENEPLDTSNASDMLPTFLGEFNESFEIESEEKEVQILSSEVDETDLVTVVYCSNCGSNILDDKKLAKTFNRRCFMKEVKSSDHACMRYTGVPKCFLLKRLFKWIKPAAKDMKLWDGKRKYSPKRKQGRKRTTLSLFEEFVLTLVRIRRGYDTNHLAFLFGVSQSHVCRLFITWVNCLSKCLEQLIEWPPKHLVAANLPSSFREFPNTRCIIDCSEIYVEKPFRPKAQRITWSNYKHNNTLKLLVGIVPTGAITYISKLYSGSISDVAIVNESGFVDKVQEGDDIMADRGFNIRHLLLKKKASLNIPAFSHGKTLSAKAVKRSRRVASVRIHVERAIRRMKTFRIISGIVPLKLRYLLNQILVIIVVLCNLQDRLVKD